VRWRGQRSGRPHESVSTPPPTATARAIPPPRARPHTRRAERRPGAAGGPVVPARTPRAASGESFSGDLAAARFIRDPRFGDSGRGVSGGPHSGSVPGFPWQIWRSASLFCPHGGGDFFFAFRCDNAVLALAPVSAIGFVRATLDSGPWVMYTSFFVSRFLDFCSV
jgi:hypothetical protein